MGFSRQEYWSGLHCPPPGDLPNAGIEPASLISPALAGGFFTTSASVMEIHIFSAPCLFFQPYSVVSSLKQPPVSHPSWRSVPLCGSLLHQPERQIEHNESNGVWLGRSLLQLLPCSPGSHPCPVGSRLSHQIEDPASVHKGGAQVHLFSGSASGSSKDTRNFFFSLLHWVNIFRFVEHWTHEYTLVLYVFIHFGQVEGDGASLYCCQAPFGLAKTLMVILTS